MTFCVNITLKSIIVDMMIVFKFNMGMSMMMWWWCYDNSKVTMMI